MASPSKAVLITGCSTGIGRGTAELLAANGHTVYATARKLEAIQDLQEKGCKLLALDVNDEASMAAAVKAVEDAEGAVGALVNNAGYSQSGALEDIPIDSIRSQFETNVFGLIRMCQLVLPGMRKQGEGRIVNIGSMGGTLVFPGGGVYHATKYAVEALSDALRFEVKGFGVKVVLIQPGLIRTEFGNTAGESLAVVSQTGGAYDDFNAAVGKNTADAYENPLYARFGGGPEDVAKVIEKALTTSRPKARYAVTISAHAIMGQRKLMTDRMWDAFVGTQFPTPGKG
jgi:NADP-dependent 3-hydroxy acid dehydrogenase YdfG